ncbi:hypothetical protein C4571_00155 [Candidatus Parcubacteria bacterium]|nr:MAG: hypothetical protein C4571_00155 [Candidatus Parcubacteria bacterium]
MKLSVFPILLFLAVFFSTSFGAEEPRVYLEAERGALLPGEEIPVHVLMGSEDPVNVFDLQIGYSTSTLEFLTLKNDDSIVDVWVLSQEKTTVGSIALGGGVVKGFEGKRGKIATLVFRAKKPGIANLYFTSANIYYADGKGTRAESLGFPLELKIGEEAKKTNVVAIFVLGIVLLMIIGVLAGFLFRRARARK